MRIAALLGLLLFLYTPANGQAETDILRKKIAAANNDSLKLESYKQVVSNYQYTNIDSAIYFLNEGYDIFRKNGYRPGMSQLLILLAEVYEEQGIPDLAKKKLEEALEIAKELKDAKSIASVNTGLGVIEGKAGNFDASTRYLFEAMRLFKSIGDTNGIVSTYIKLGATNSRAEHYQSALSYLNEALVMLKDMPVRPNTVNVFNDIGATYARQEKYDSALIYFKKALELCKQKGFRLLSVNPLTNIGNVYRLQNNNVRALEYFNEALAIASKEKMPEEQIRLQLSIAKITAQTNPQKALAALTIAMDSVVKTGEKLLELEVLSTIIEVHKMAGNYKEAFLFVDRTTELEDSLFNIEKSRQLQNFQMAYETDKTNAKLKQLETTELYSKKRRNIITTVAIVLFIALVGITLFYRKTRKLNVQLAKANADKDRLFSIIGHDLRGPVANVPVMIDLCKDVLTSNEERDFLLDAVKTNSEITLETLEKLLSWGRANMKGISSKKVTFNAYANVQDKILLLNRTAEQKKIHLINNVSEDITVHADAEHFSFVVRNLLSNALKFTNTGGTVQINADVNTKPGFVLFFVKDTGVGMDKEQQTGIFDTFIQSTPGTANEPGTGLGLMLCKKFVKENGGKIWVESEKNAGTVFYFTIKAGTGKAA